MPSWLSFNSGGKSAADLAQFYPRDTLAYGWMTLNPGDGQRGQMTDIWDRLKQYQAIMDLIDQLNEEFDDTEIDFREDVGSWIGPEFSFGLIEVDYFGDSDFIAAATVGVRDQDAAQDFLDQWLTYIELEAVTSFETGSYRGTDIWVAEDVSQAYALTDDWLVIATGETELMDLLDRIAGDGGPSLADNRQFIDAHAALRDRRFASFYLDTQQALELSEDAMDAIAALSGADRYELASQTPDWLAASATWFERGAAIEFVAPVAIVSELNAPDLDNPAELMPANTLGFLAATYDPDLDHWRAELSNYRLNDLFLYEDIIDELSSGMAGFNRGGAPRLGEDATLADALNVLLWSANDLTSIDLEQDFFDYLAGEIILAVYNFDFEWIETDPVPATLMLAYRNDSEVGLAATMEEFEDLITVFGGLRATNYDVGADNAARLFDLGFDAAGYQPGYVIHDGYLTMGTYDDALRTVVRRQDGSGSGLDEDPEYLRAVAQLPEPRQFLAYVSLRDIFGQLDAYDMDLEPHQFRLLADALGVSMASWSSDDQLGRISIALTLFPE